MKTLEERFWSKVDRKDPAECWEWQAGKFSQGYGQFSVGAKNKLAHRVSYELAHGPIPEGLVVRHKCDNPCCVNPDHLELGTHENNMDDRASRGRGAKGEAQGGAKLTEDVVRAIRLDGRLQVEIAASYGISQITVSRIKRRSSWSHIA